MEAGIHQGFTRRNPGEKLKNQGVLSREMRRQVKGNAMEIGGKSMEMRGKPRESRGKTRGKQGENQGKRCVFGAKITMFVGENDNFRLGRCQLWLGDNFGVENLQVSCGKIVTVNGEHGSWKNHHLNGEHGHFHGINKLITKLTIAAIAFGKPGQLEKPPPFIHFVRGSPAACLVWDTVDLGHWRALPIFFCGPGCHKPTMTLVGLSQPPNIPNWWWLGDADEIGWIPRIRDPSPLTNGYLVVAWRLRSHDFRPVGDAQITVFGK